jgi:hypothetical protein
MNGGDAELNGCNGLLKILKLAVDCYFLIAGG